MSGLRPENRFGYVLDVFAGRVPEEFLPIARDPFGNLLCIGVIGERAGQIYFWDHEFEAPEGQPAHLDNLTLVAQSFAEFLGGLYFYVWSADAEDAPTGENGRQPSNEDAEPASE